MIFANVQSSLRLFYFYYLISSHFSVLKEKKLTTSVEFLTALKVLVFHFPSLVLNLWSVFWQIHTEMNYFVWNCYIMMFYYCFNGLENYDNRKRDHFYAQGSKNVTHLNPLTFITDVWVYLKQNQTCFLFHQNCSSIMIRVQNDPYSFSLFFFFTAKGERENGV